MIKKFLSIFKESAQRFEGEEAGERVILLLRRHRFVLYTPLTILAMSWLAPVVIYLVFSSVIASAGLTYVFFFFASLWCMAFWLATFYALTLYTLNTMIVTDRRVIDNDQFGLFDRKVSELHIYRVQDVSIHITGFISTLLGFGEIVIQTASTDKQFVFEQIPNPADVKDTIMKLVASQHSGVKPL